jgi:hypothetical protein
VVPQYKVPENTLHLEMNDGPRYDPITGPEARRIVADLENAGVVVFRKNKATKT